MPSINPPTMKMNPPHLPPEPVAPRDLVSIHDLAPTEILSLFNLTSMLKQRPADFRGVLAGKQMVMFFEKPSLRTRLTFEAGMDSLGGSTFFVDQTASRLNARESLYDIAHNLERWIDIIVLRTFSHAVVEEMATYAGVPVINALSELEHPCQALADFFTLQEHLGDLKKLHFAYVGDGNNMAHSLLLAGASVGAKVSIATPDGYGLNPVIVTMAKAIADETKAGPYQVNAALMQLAKPHARFMHCLPAHRGCEVTDQVIDSLNSVVFDQAENRLHIQKAILVWLLGGGVGRFPARSAHA